MNTRGKTKNKARSHSEVKDRKEVGGRERGIDTSSHCYLGTTSAQEILLAFWSKRMWESSLSVQLAVIKGSKGIVL